MSDPNRAPRPRNRNGQIPVPRSWLTESRTLSDRAFRLHMILAAYADWDARHPRFKLVQLTHRDLTEVVASGWSRPTFWRAAQELIAAGYLERTGSGEYKVLNLESFLIGRARARSDSPEKRLVSPERRRVSMVNRPVSVEKHNTDISERNRPPKNLENLKNESTENGDLFYCEYFPRSKRAIVEKRSGIREFETIWTEFHSSRRSRGFGCDHTRCRQVPSDLAEASSINAKINPGGYLKKALAEVLEKETDANVKTREVDCRRRPPLERSPAYTRAADLVPMGIHQ